MALYEYVCTACGQRTEKRMPMSEVVQTVPCGSCGKPANKAIGGWAFVGKSEPSFFDGPAPWDSEGGAGDGDGDGGGHSHDFGGHGHSHGPGGHTH